MNKIKLMFLCAVVKKHFRIITCMQDQFRASVNDKSLKCFVADFFCVADACTSKKLLSLKGLKMVVLSPVVRSPLSFKVVIRSLEGEVVS